MTTDTTNEATGLLALLDRWEAAHERWKLSLRLRRTLPSLVVPATRELLEAFDPPPPASAFPKDDGERMMMPVDEFRLAQPDRLSDDVREKAERDLREVLDAWVSLSVQTNALLRAAMAAKHEGVTDAHVQDALNASQNLRHRVLFSRVRPLVARLRDVVDALRVVARNRESSIGNAIDADVAHVIECQGRVAIIARLAKGAAKPGVLNALVERVLPGGRAKERLRVLKDRGVIDQAKHRNPYSLLAKGKRIANNAAFLQAAAHPTVRAAMLAAK